MLTVLSVEVRKLNRSLALVLAATAPALIAVFAFSMLLRSKTPSEWDMWIGSGMAIWAYFMMPLCVAALTALVDVTLAVDESAPCLDPGCTVLGCCDTEATAG